MTLSKEHYSVGEVAKSTGLTVRTLQHYDNIGLLPASGRTEGGRRFYTQSDLLKLEQIVFYKSIGIALEEIKEKMVELPTLAATEKTLTAHHAVMVKKIDALHMALSVMTASLEVIKAGTYPPWDMLAQLIRMMDGSSLNDWMGYSFDPRLYAHLAQSGMTTMQGAMEFYHTIRELMVEAATLNKAACKPEDASAQAVAKRWWTTIMGMTSGDDVTVAALSTVNRARETWPEADRKLFEAAEPFLESALGIYLERNQIEVPEALLDKEP